MTNVFRGRATGMSGGTMLVLILFSNIHFASAVEGDRAGVSLFHIGSSVPAATVDTRLNDDRVALCNDEIPCMAWQLAVVEDVRFQSESESLRSNWQDVALGSKCPELAHIEAMTRLVSPDVDSLSVERAVTIAIVDVVPRTNGTSPASPGAPVRSDTLLTQRMELPFGQLYLGY
ncbi:MAG: hypothetical protein R3E01_08650 [Pirellulaceae bacterium]|nr:hypothetical protein [Planctomycetales bacterium]